MTTERLFDTPVPVPLPKWWTATQRENYRAGLHPTGLDLLGGAETCGTCRYPVGRGRNRTYIKCGLMTPTRGAGTDIRLKWKACVLWEAGGDD